MIPGVDQRPERERRIAQPAVSVIPVHRSAWRFRQGGCRRRNQTPRRTVDHGLEGQQRSPHGVRPAGLLVIKTANPVAPECLCPQQRGFGIQGQRCRPGHVVVLHDEDKALPCRDAEHRLRRMVAKFKRDWRVHCDPVRPDGRNEPVSRRLGPGHHGSVIEPQAQIDAKLTGAFDTFDDAHQRRHILAERHEINEPDTASSANKVGFHYQCVGLIATGRFSGWPVAVPVCQTNQPASVRGPAKKRRKARGAVEARPAQPVDRAVATDESGGFPVADERVVFEGSAQRRLSFSNRPWMIIAVPGPGFFSHHPLAQVEQDDERAADHQQGDQT